MDDTTRETPNAFLRPIERFRGQLPQRLQELDQLLQRAAAGDIAAMRDARHIAQRLAITAATYDFALLSGAAEDLSIVLESDIAQGGLSLAGMESFQRLESARNDGGADGCVDGDVGPRVVFVPGEPGSLPQETLDQFELFGFHVHRIGAVTSIHEFMSGHGACRAAVILGELSYFDTQPKELDDMRRLRTVYAERLRVVLLADDDDFATRLRSVRCGADAFFSGSVDIAQLADKLDTLLNEHDSAPYHVLVVDDDPEQVAETALTLQQAGMITSVVTDPTRVFEVLVEEKPELILMDMYMPSCSGVELASVIRQNDGFVGIPIVFLSIERDESKQLIAIRSGGDGFLTKPVDPEYMVTSVRIRAARTRTMRFFMERDSLTGLLNHTNLKRRLEQEVHRAQRVNAPFCFVMIDLDHFKYVNDAHGHLTGDRVLKTLARLLQERLRRSDVIGRYGGEEFGVILVNIELDRAFYLMDEIREMFAMIKQSSGRREFSVTLSCGIAAFPAYGTAPAMSEAADAALYRAKSEGRNRVVVARSANDAGK